MCASVTRDLPMAPSKSREGSERDCAPYGRGEGLVDSPRHPEAGAFPLLLPLRSDVRYLSPPGVHRRVQRGYIGLSMRLSVHRLGGGRHGA